jgi:hypothetical protein
MDQVKRERRRHNRHWMCRSAKSAAALLCLLTILMQPAQAADEPTLEYRVKAAFLLNFVKFTEWPASAFPSADAPLSVCILGLDPFGGTIDQISRGEVVNGRRIEIQRLKRAPVPRACQVLFVGKEEKDQQGTLAGLNAGVLTVGEEDDFLQAGGMIAFVIANRRTRFDVNQAAVERAGLKLSSRMLSVARAVKQ